MAHSFISYNIPVRIPVAKAAAASISSAASAATAAASGTGLLDNLKSALFGAVSKASSAATASPSAPSASIGAKSAAAKTEFQTIEKTIPCITTSGETFAIWLNVVYLAPLTYLFASFFVASYLRRSNAEAKRKLDRRLSQAQLAEKASWDAAKEITSEVYGEGNQDEAVVEEDGEVSGDANGRATRSKANGKVAANGRAKKH